MAIIHWMINKQVTFSTSVNWLFLSFAHGFYWVGSALLLILGVLYFLYYSLVSFSCWAYYPPICRELSVNFACDMPFIEQKYFILV